MKKTYLNIIITVVLILLIAGVAGCGYFLKKVFDERGASAETETTTFQETVTTEQTSPETTTPETTTQAPATETATQETTTEKETPDVSMYDTPIERFLYSITDIDTMILVVGDGITNNSAVLYYYAKNEDGEWECQHWIDAWCGSNGFSNSTYEGDHTTPVGCFEMGIAFGNYENPGTELEWVDVNEHLYWVDDITSEYYEQLIDDREVPPDAWNHGEHLIDYGDAYGYSIHIKVNPPYETSAIFLHNDGHVRATAGCVGIAENSMRWILQNIKTDTRIAIVENEDDLDHIDELRER